MTTKNRRLHSTLSIHIAKHRRGDVDRKDVIAKMRLMFWQMLRPCLHDSRICEEADTSDKAHFDVEPPARI
jgi:hypothetical protein